MSFQKKKKNGWKIAFFILLALIVVFFLWIFLSKDDSDWVEENETLYEKDTAVRARQVELKGDGKDTVTILVYMNGSNLETDDSEATTDLTEMVKAGSSDKVNVIVQTMNTKKWSSKYGISSNRSQIYKLDGKGMTLVKDDLGQLDCTESSTLRDFIIWGAQNYPADRYILQFWDHGGGPVYGFGYDDITESEEVLSTDEIQKALYEAGVYFDFIGMDCCLMSCLEVSCALYDYCDYMILSEDFESGLGWSYTKWLKALYENSSISTPDLGKIIIDEMVNANSSDTEGWGDDSILALIDESTMKVLFTAWTDFAYANEDALLQNNYARKKSMPTSGRVHPSLLSKGFFTQWLYDEEEYYMSDYYVTDIMALADTLDTDESKALESAVSNAIVYVNSCGDDTSLTGISVTLPYGDSEFYYDLQTVFTNCGFSSEYITWLEKFTDAEGADSFYDYGNWDSDWSGWDNYEDDYNWSDWYEDYDDEYWEDDDWGWSIFDYLFSWNSWYSDDDWYYDDNSDNWSYEGDDWYYGDYYDNSRQDDWYDYRDDYRDDYYGDNYYGNDEGWHDDWRDDWRDEGPGGYGGGPHDGWDDGYGW